MMQPKLQQLVNKGLLWQGRQSLTATSSYLYTGSQTLDKLLGGGWQLGGLHECQRPLPFIEQRLLLPLLLQAEQRQLPIFWINPVAQLSAAGLQWQLSDDACHIVMNCSPAEGAWAFEQVLQSGAGLALLWHPPQKEDASTVRRWYKAAQAGRQTGIVFTDVAPDNEARAYTNRLRLKGSGVGLDIIKRRFGWPVMDVEL